MKKHLLATLLLSGCLSALAQTQREWRDVSYVDDNQVGHLLDIYLPQMQKDKYKVVVTIYGSAWFGNSDKQKAFQTLGEPLLNAGFAVVSINHRASTEAAFPAQIQDVKAAIRFIRGNADKYHLDTSFIGITGYSSGGHLASLAGVSNGVKNYAVGKTTIDIEGALGNHTDESSAVDAVVDWFGPIDMSRMHECRTFKNEKSPEAVLIGGNPADNREMIDLLSPLTYIDENDPKFLLIHGTSDTVVPDCQSVFFAEALRQKGLLDNLIRVPKGEHGPVTFNKETFKKMADFLAQQALYATSGNGLSSICVQTKYTADPAPMVHDGKVFLYTTHDADHANGFEMKNWLLYSTEDMVNWTDHGIVASLDNFKWRTRDNGAWAEQVVERNGKFYMYCPLHGNGIGVLVADTPYGPFKDPLGKPLVWQKEHWDDIDPTVFIDDDGQAYMYWGNPNLYHVKLNEDMISYMGEIVKHPKIEDYQEGPWLWKRNGHYYLAFASTCCPEGIGYAMSQSPEGPWEYKGHIMNHTDKTRGNHPGIIDYKGKSYVFGLNYDLLRLETPHHHERRNCAVAEMHYNADGTIIEVPYFKETTMEMVGTFHPYRRVEAETIAWGYGLKTENRTAQNLYVTKVDDGDTLVVRGVDFGKKGARQFRACVASAKGNVQIEVHLDSANGPLAGTLQVDATGGDDAYKVFKTSISGAKGVHDLVFRFRGAEKNNLLNWDYWEFK